MLRTRPTTPAEQQQLIDAVEEVKPRAKQKQWPKRKGEAPHKRRRTSSRQPAQATGHPEPQPRLAGRQRERGAVDGNRNGTTCDGSKAKGEPINAQPFAPCPRTRASGRAAFGLPFPSAAAASRHERACHRGRPFRTKGMTHLPLACGVPAVYTGCAKGWSANDRAKIWPCQCHWRIRVTSTKMWC